MMSFFLGWVFGMVCATLVYILIEVVRHEESE